MTSANDLPGADEQCTVPFKLLFQCAQYIADAHPLLVDLERLLRGHSSYAMRAKQMAVLTELGREIATGFSMVSAIEKARNSSSEQGGGAR